MKQLLCTVIISLIGVTCFAQSAEELNEKSKELLQNGDFEKAIPLLAQAAELGNPEAQYNLGYCYHSGSGVEKNSEKAVSWYTKSADLGFNDALYQMMMAYGNGDGVTQDVEKAFTYALQCAENNDGTCMWNVANCYYQGLGVERDLTKMVVWATRLGKLENPEDLTKSGYITSARLQLAYMFRDGTEIEMDLAKSYQWFLIFNEYKKDFSYIQQQSIVKEIQALEAMLTAEQKANGQQEAEALLGRPLVNIENLYRAEFH